MIHATTASEWRRWLRENHDKADGVWLVSWRSATGKPRLYVDRTRGAPMSAGGRQRE